MNDDLHTRRYTDAALDFIARHRDRPFFLFLAHAMPHTRIGASAPFRGQSKLGLYGDAVEELDASTGEILAALQRHGLDERTVVVFFSDNGAALPPVATDAIGRATWDAVHAGDDGHGSNAPFRGGKQSYYEGGLHVPFIVRAPGRVPAGRVLTTPIGVCDLAPTVLEWGGVKPGDPGPQLFNLAADPGETLNLLVAEPARAAAMAARLATIDAEVWAEARTRGYEPARLPP